MNAFRNLLRLTCVLVGAHRNLYKNLVPSNGGLAVEALLERVREPSLGGRPTRGAGVSLYRWSPGNSHAAG